MSQNLAMEESPSLKEKQALRFDEKFYFWLARGDLDHTLYLNYSKRNQFRDLRGAYYVAGSRTWCCGFCLQ